MLKKFRYVAFVSLEPATSVACECGTFSVKVLENLADNLSDSGSAMGIYEKAMGGRGAVGGQADGQRESG